MKRVIRGVLIGVMLLNLVGAMPARAAGGLQVSKRSLNFGQQGFATGSGASSSTSQPHTVKISNTGTAITGLNIQVSGSDAGDFQKASTDCTANLGAGANCSVTLTFTPGGPRRRIATLMLADDSNPSAGALKLVGIGIPLQNVAAPSSLKFGSVPVGQKSSKKVKVTNPNKLAVSIQSIATSSAFGAFTQSNSCGSSIGPGKSCQVTVTFIPTVRCNPKGGIETGTLAIKNQTGPAAVSLSGTAVQNAQTAIFVTNQVSNTVTTYPLSAVGNVDPIAVIGDPFGLTNPHGIGVDAVRNIYVPNKGTSSISVYSTCANNIVTPIATIVGDQTALNNPEFAALDSNGNIYVANGFDVPAGNQTLTIYPPLGNSSGIVNEAPIATISGPNTGLVSANIWGVAVGSSGKIYLINGSTISIFPALGSSTGNLDESPLATISGTNPGLVFPQALAVDVDEKIYVTDFTSGFGSHVLRIFPAVGSNRGPLDELPLAIISGADTGLDGSDGIALDSGGNIYVANDTFIGIGIHGTVTVYPPLGSSTGNIDVQPTVTVVGADTGLAFPDGIALDSSGNVYVANSIGGKSGFGSVTIYGPLAGKSGNLDDSPNATVGGNSQLAIPAGIAVDSLGNVYVSNVPNDNLTVHQAGSNGDVPPNAVIVDSNGPPSVIPHGVALDSTANIYVAYAGGSIAVLPPVGTSTGLLSEPSTTTITGSNTLISDPFGIALDSSGNIYATDSSNTVTIFSGGSDGNVAPKAAIGGAATQLSGPLGVALDSSERIYVANSSGGISGKGSITIYPSLGGNTGSLDEIPIATIAGSNSLLNVPTGVALDLTGNIYVTNAVSLNLLDVMPGSITVYPPLGTSTGDLNEAPIATISGPKTLLFAPSAITIGPFIP